MQSGTYTVTIPHPPRNFSDLFESLFNRLVAIRVDQAAGCRRKKAAGQQQFEIDPFVPEHAPNILKLKNKALKILLFESLHTGRNDSPNNSLGCRRFVRQSLRSQI